MSQISLLSKLAISVAVCISTGVPHTTFHVPQQPNLLLADTFETKAWFYHFTRHKANMTAVFSNKRTKSGFARAGPLTRVVGRGVELAASYTRISTDSDSTLLSSHIWISSDRNRLGPDSFSLMLWNTQFRCTE